MRFTTHCIPTLRESPADAEAISHKLLVRAGLVRKLTSGIYIYLPLGLKVIRKIESIVREEMENAGFQEVLLPMVQPADLWKETGRWAHYGKELLRLTDRNERDYCLGPTHEEVVTDLARREIRSYKQLPVRIYQIQTKFRDEMRPRFGLLRGREFIMKDAYSFDIDERHATESYELMKAAYLRIFGRLCLKFRPVEADTGSIGGSFSHEFMVLADTGEDTIVFCNDCDFAANVERAGINSDSEKIPHHCDNPVTVSTPGIHTVEQVSKFLGIPKTSIIKTIIYTVGCRNIAVLVRGDREVNEAKLRNFLGAAETTLANAETVADVTGAPVGFAGPINIDIPIYADNELQYGTDYVTGANSADSHMMHVDLERDATITSYADLRNIEQDDQCPQCGGKLTFKRGIEVGHIFMLGEKYSRPMDASFLNADGCEHTFVMGCYGIGISRIAAAAIEQNHDEKGIIFPPSISPADCLLINLDPRNARVTEAANHVYEQLRRAGADILFDDRDERPGIKFNDADLLGIPIQLIVGKRGLERGIVEYKNRKTGVKGEISLNELVRQYLYLYQNVRLDWEDKSI